MAQAVSSPNPPASGGRRTGPGVEVVAVIAFAAVAIGAHAAIFLPYLLTAEGRLGGDFSYFLPQLLAGHFWFLQNGPLAVPWFTPAFCGGIPYFPNMQSVYYSVPQVLTFGIGPIRAVEATFVLFAAAGYWGAYRLLRQSFAIGPWSATAGATLFLFNGFYAGHFLVGHLTFHAFMLVPWIAVFALTGAKDRDKPAWFDAGVAAGALVIAYMIHSGMVHALPPSLAAVAAIWLLHVLLFRPDVRPFARLVAMTAIALVLGAAKLTAGFAYLAQFPRDMISIAGFAELWQVLFVAFVSVSVAPPIAQTNEWLVNTEWGDGLRIILGNHEFDFRMTILPAILVAVWLVRTIVRLVRKGAPAAPRWKLAAGIAFAAIVISPIFLNWNQPEWTAFLKSLPVLRNSSTLIRWFCLFVIVGAVASALIVDRLPLSAPARAIMGVVVAATVIYTNATLERKYETQIAVYSPAKIEAAYRSVAASGRIPAISRIVTPGHAPFELTIARDRNDYMADGGSSVQCYEPMFGYFMEQFPQGRMHAGPPLAAEDGMLNLKNPACMVYPDANECRPGDHFTEAQAPSAQRFVDYRPFEFRLPWWQRLANWTSLAAFAAVLSSLGIAMLRRFRRGGAPACGSAQRSPIAHG